MTDFLGQIDSLCPECLRVVAGRLMADGEHVRMEKSCPEHGLFKATVWRGKPPILSWFRPKLPYFGGHREKTAKGCPYDCGLCLSHSQRTCTALVEITGRCNLRCPVCFADSGTDSADPGCDELARMFAQIMTRTGGCNLQLSGGEPTVRKDLPRIINLAADAGFSFIQLNTNGLAFAEDAGLAPRLKKAGLSSIFLQFDGVRDEVFQSLRGRQLLGIKKLAIDRLAEAGLGIVLVATVVREVNEDQLWPLVRFGLDRQPQVRGVHFQPISYFGRYPVHFRPEHITLPELMQGLADQSRGLLAIEDFRPPGCEHALCSFSARYLSKEDGGLQRLGAASCDCAPQPAEKGALTAIGVTARQWGFTPENDNSLESAAQNELDRFVSRVRSHTFGISAMAFQDAWTVNLERLRGCCIHVARPDGRLIPFCSYNLTARNGRSLYRPPRPVSSRKITPVDGLVASRLQIPGRLTESLLEQAQLEALRRTVVHARKHSPWYRKSLAGIEPKALQTRQDLVRLPMLSGRDLAEHGHLLLAVSQSRVSRMVTLQTSGSTGPPKRLAFSAKDLVSTMAFFGHGMRSLIGSGDRVLVLLPYETPDSVGDLLIRALRDWGIEAIGLWPPPAATAAAMIRSWKLTCAVGLPQHLLALAHELGRNFLRSMLLCSDYAPLGLRRQLESICGCETFLHYGATESGLGGAVECSAHRGCHLRESDLLVEIVDPGTGEVVPDGAMGEVVFTTLNREAMPLLRYRTGDMARLTRLPCRCSGITARLDNIRGRLAGCRLPDGALLESQELDDRLFEIDGLIDYRLALTGNGDNRLEVDFLAAGDTMRIGKKIGQSLEALPVLRRNLEEKTVIIGKIRPVAGFAPTHTVKRTIVDQRT
jgi:7,8-dihydro-6-hydroxymethylpterin dimethyltransferase